jgi:dihydropteroate synthase
MGIVNVTPDSFSDGAMFASADDAVAHGARLVDEGADLVDVGGESTRPGSDPIDPTRSSFASSRLSRGS